jgi:D-alanine-D-alanine ligase
MGLEARVGLLFGGRSVEHEVSVISARGVAAAMDDTSLTCVPIAVTPEGEWLGPELSTRILKGDAARVEIAAAGDDGERLALVPGGGVQRTGRDGPARLAIDVIFPLIHGWGGEDGRLQGALELCGVPYVGAGVLGSSAGMDKVTSKILFTAHGLPVCAWDSTSRVEIATDAEGVGRRVAEGLGFPVFVKPSNGGSSLGVRRADGAESFLRALDHAAEFDDVVLIEEAVDAREIECAVLGNDAPEASGLGEIVPSGEFYDYAAKYLDDRSELKIPAPLEPEQTRRLREMAVRAFRALGLRGFARVDFLVRREGGEAFLNEVNTLPGFTPISMFPKLWDAAGLSYPRLIERLVRLALPAG